MRGTRARCSLNVLSIFLRRVDCVYPVKPSAHAPGKATMLKRPAPARPIYQALTHLERYHSLICKMFLRAKRIIDGAHLQPYLLLFSISISIQQNREAPCHLKSLQRLSMKTEPSTL